MALSLFQGHLQLVLLIVQRFKRQICFQHLVKFMLPFNGNKWELSLCPYVKLVCLSILLVEFLVTHFSCFFLGMMLYANLKAPIVEEKEGKNNHPRGEKINHTESKTTQLFFSLGVPT